MRWLPEYKKSLKMPEVEESLDLVIYRPLAFLLVKLIFRTGITPDHLTIAAILTGVTGGVLYAFGSTITTNIGAALFMLFIILDCSDGQLARLKKNGTPIGRLLDGIADYIVVISIYAGIAIGYYQKEGQPSSLLILLFLSGVSVIAQSMFVDFYRTRFLDIVLKRKNTLEEGVHEYRKEYIRLKNTPGKWVEKNIVLIYLIYSKVQRILTAKKNREENFNFSPELYYKRNRILIRLWLLMGPSAGRTALIICSFFSRFDLYFWITILIFNLLAALLWIIQRYINNSFRTQLK